jgi:polysaccharide chain length determinant protein (PEP-CTERM system associated)
LTDQKRTISIQDLIDALIKKWYWASMPLVFFILAGIWFYIVLPKVYEAKTSILVLPQVIPKSYVQGPVSYNVEEQVKGVSQEVLSRTNLEAIINEMNLFPQERKEGTPVGDLVAYLRNMITIKTEGGNPGQESYFSITCRAPAPPQLVADFTNRLAAQFIENNLKQRARQANETTEFMQKQLDDLKVLLGQQEAKVTEYRNRYLGELPDQLNSNVSTISSLQMRLESLQASLTAAMNRRLTIQGQISQAESSTPGTLSRRGQRIADLRNQLEEMKSKYTPDYPDIKRLENQIADLENQRDKTPTVWIDPRAAELKNQLNVVNIEINTLHNDVNRLKAQIEQYQGRVEDTPKREQELVGLNRDYNITQQNYQRLLDKLYEAKRGEDLEKRQQGAQFRILDYSQLPQTPVSPNLLRIALIFIVLGLGTGAGIILMFEMFDNTVRGVKQLVSWSGTVPCITAIPLALTESDKRKERFTQAVYFGINGAIFVGWTIIIIISKLSHIVLKLPIPLPF